MTTNTTVTATSLGGALGIVVVFIAGALGLNDIPAEVGAAVATLFTGILGLVVPAKSNDHE